MSARLRIAIVGAGMSGLTTARLLHGAHDVTVFESADRIGGHAQVIQVPDANGEMISVDAGVCMYYTTGYPTFFRLLQSLGITTEPLDARVEIYSIPTEQRYQFDLNAPWKTLAQSLVSPQQRWFVKDGLRFYQRALEATRHPTDLTETLADHLAAEGYSEPFRILLSFLCGATWTINQKGSGDVPFAFVARTMWELGFLPTARHGAWHHVPGSVRRYLDALAAPLRGQIRLGANVERVERHGPAIAVHHDGGEEAFDHVVFAIPPRRALERIADPTAAEQEVLSAFSSQDCTIIYTSDEKLARSWTSDNTAMFAASDVTERSQEAGREYLFRVGFANLTTMWRRKLARPFYMWYQFPDSPWPEHQWARVPFSAPVFTREALESQTRHAEISGRDRLHFCGTAWVNGIHEGTVVSALNVAKWFGRDLSHLKNASS